MTVASNTQPKGNSALVAHIPAAGINGGTVVSKLGELHLQANVIADTGPSPSVNGYAVNGTDAPASHTTEEQKLRQPLGFDTVAPYPVSDLKLEDSLIDDFRPLRVAVIGAGLSGILSGILFPEKVPNVQLTIFEKNKEVVSRGHPEEHLTFLCLNSLGITAQHFFLVIAELGKEC